MKEDIRLDGIGFEIKRKDIKHTYIRIDLSKRLVKISAPKGIGNKEIYRIIKSREGWIRDKFNQIDSKIIIRNPRGEDGELVRFFSKELKLYIVYIKTNPEYIIREGDFLRVYIKETTSREKIISLINSWYRIELKEEVGRYVGFWEREMGLKVKEYRIKSMKTRWGTCNPKAGRIWINLDLVKIDKEFLNYIVVHEMTHLIERGHGKAFKKILDHYLPNWRQVESRLDRYIF